VGYGGDGAPLAVVHARVVRKSVPADATTRAGTPARPLDERAWLAATCANAAGPTAQMPRRVGMERTWSRLGIFTVALVVAWVSLLATSVSPLLRKMLPRFLRNTGSDWALGLVCAQSVPLGQRLGLSSTTCPGAPHASLAAQTLGGQRAFGERRRAVSGLEHGPWSGTGRPQV